MKPCLPASSLHLWHISSAKCFWRGLGNLRSSFPPETDSHHCLYPSSFSSVFQINIYLKDLSPMKVTKRSAGLTVEDMHLKRIYEPHPIALSPVFLGRTTSIRELTLCGPEGPPRTNMSLSSQSASGQKIPL